MRTKDVQVGQTYRCEVPFALAYRRYRPETMGDFWWALSWLRGTYFPLSRHGRRHRGPYRPGPADGLHHPRHGGAHRGPGRGRHFPPGHGYQITGMLLDAEGEPVPLPRVAALTVPLRWLHPMDTPVSGGHHDASLRGF